MNELFLSFDISPGIYVDSRLIVTTSWGRVERRILALEGIRNRLTRWCSPTTCCRPASVVVHQGWIRQNGKFCSMLIFDQAPSSISNLFVRKKAKKDKKRAVETKTWSRSFLTAGTPSSFYMSLRLGSEALTGHWVLGTTSFNTVTGMRCPEHGNVAREADLNKLR